MGDVLGDLNARRARIEALPVDEKAALRVAKLADLHRDPFDRLLVAQALEEELAIAVPEQALYEIRTFGDIVRYVRSARSRSP